MDLLDFNNVLGDFTDKKKDNNFALIVVLFILLILVGTSFGRGRY